MSQCLFQVHQSAADIILAGKPSIKYVVDHKPCTLRLYGVININQVNVSKHSHRIISGYNVENNH